MRRTLLFSILLTGLFFKTAAQPVLNDAEKYTTGKTFDFYIADTAGVVPGPGGNNVTWDFSTLQQKTGTVQKQALLPAQTGYAADFPNADIAIKDNADNYLFFRDRNDTLWMEGLRVETSDITIKHSKPQVYFIRPLTMNTTFSGTAGYTYNFQNTSFQGGGNYQLTADGYGTLVLPTGTFSNVIRTKYEQHFFDTMQNANFIQEIKTTTYSWYNAYNNAPLLTIDSTGISSPQFSTVSRSVQYQKNVSNSIASLFNENRITVYANAGQLVFNGLAAGETYTARIYDMAGKQITSGQVQTGDSSGSLQLPGTLQAGCYIVQLSGENKSSQFKFMIL